MQGLRMGLPDLKSKKKGKQRVLKGSHVAEALNKLKEQTRETVKGLESMSNPGGDDFEMDAHMEAFMEYWMKQFEKFAGSQEMISIAETLVQKICKEIFHELMNKKEDRYPHWLEEHKASLSKEEYERYSNQYELIKELNGLYENDPNNFPRIADHMRKLQEYGELPNDIQQEVIPELKSKMDQLILETVYSHPNCCIL